MSAGALCLAAFAGSGPGAPAAGAVGPPVLGSAWSSAVFSGSARLNAEIDPEGFPTTYHFDYIAEAAFEANLADGKDGFAGALRSPTVADANVGSGSGFVVVQRLLSGLQPDTRYRYRAVAQNSSPGTATGPALSFFTRPAVEAPIPPDGRAWEMVSPVAKNGGQVEAPGAIAGGGLLRAAAGGGAVVYSTMSAFGVGVQGAPFASQYIALRGAGGWSSQNIDPPLVSGAYDSSAQNGVPYRLFSDDLARGLLLSGDRCRTGGSGCPVPNPPLAGTDAPAGYRNYYLRETATAGFEALLGAPDVAGLATDPADFDLVLAGAAPDLRHVAISTCSALTPDATEVPSGAGCDPAQPNLYLWSAAGLSLVNTTPGAAPAAPLGAISDDGARIYWKDLSSGNLHLRNGAEVDQVDTAAGGGGTFEAATPNGEVALYTKAGDLWRYDSLTGSSVELANGVTGVLGISDDASHVYYLTAAGLFLLRDGSSPQKVAAAADPGNYPPATGTARVSADGSRLLFVSSAPLATSDGATYDNTDLVSGDPDSQVYLYAAAAAGTLTCVSCNPTGGRPIGPSSVPGAILNGNGAAATVSAKPRVLTLDGGQVFFDSADALVAADTNNSGDVYRWRAPGSGGCARAAGCVALLSSGKATGGASFVDASADGSDAFFLTGASLVDSDRGSVDLYDARVGGGFPQPPVPIPCEGDACQSLPANPGDPTLTTLLTGLGNPPVRYRKLNQRGAKRCRRGLERRGGKCVRKGRAGKKRAGSRGGRGR